MEEYTPVKVLDCKGLACPMPIVRASQEITKISIGEVMEIHTTDPGSIADFPAWAKTMGHQIVEIKQNPGLIQVFVRRQK
jgi:tRNA 2-thiouridine synthesizing protein A